MITLTVFGLNAFVCIFVYSPLINCNRECSVLLYCKNVEYAEKIATKREKMVLIEKPMYVGSVLEGLKRDKIIS
jgi:hypothetical protein